MKTLKTLLAWPFRSCSQASRPARPAPRRAGRRGMLAIECLEDRTAPAALSVTSAADTHQAGLLTLREAVAQANTDAGRGQSDRISFAASLGTATVTLTGGQLELSGASGSATETIDGGGRITVSGNNASRVLQIDAGVQAALAGLTLTQGRVTGTVATGGNATGGGVYTAGSTVVISDCTLSSNQARGSSPFGGGAGLGGGLYVAGGSVAIDRSALSADQASGGGGSNAFPGAGSGGGLYVAAGSVTIEQSTLSANQANGGGGNGSFGGQSGGAGSGGGIYLASGSVQVNDSTLSANRASGGLGSGIHIGQPGGPGSGGGVYLAGGSIRVNQSTLCANQATGGDGGGGGVGGGGSGGDGSGGGLDVGNGTAEVDQSTLSANRATGGVGGFGRGNGVGAGGGILIPSAAVTTPVLHNTLIAGNFTGASGTSRDDVNGALASAGDYNLIGDGAGMTGLSNGVNHNQVGSHASPINPRLGPLANNGGPTQTVALLAGSPAINAGGNAYATAYDQRGPGYPRVVGGTIDIGAFEAQAPVTYRVTSLGDTGAGSGTSGDLRYCLTQANAHPGPDVIAFSVTGTINLGGTALPTLTDPVTITGPGAASLAISTHSANRAFVVAADVTASISGLTLTNGLFASDQYAVSGGIANAGYLTLSNCTLSYNVAPSQGAGIYNVGTLTASSCTLAYNYAPGEGGGVYNAGTLALSNSTLYQDYSGSGGGGVYNAGTLTVGGSSITFSYGPREGGGLDNAGTATITASTLSGNGTSGSGGGIEDLPGGTVTVSGSTLSGNYAAGNGGGLDNGGTLALSSSTLSGNYAGGNGGGLASAPGSATATLNTSTLSGNAAAGDGGGLASAGTLRVSATTVSGNYDGGGGGGLASAGPLTVSASTLSGNGAGGNGGGLLAGAGAATLGNSTVYGNYCGLQGGGVYALSGSAADTLTLTNVTLAANWAATSGGGLCVAAGALAAPVLHNTLVAYNASGPNGTLDDVFGALAGRSDYNLIADGAGMTGISDGVNGNRVGSDASPIDPLLGPLQDNGGPTQTCALLLGSPARGGGSTAYATATDQRGQARVVTGLIDIGAYQTQDYSM